MKPERILRKTGRGSARAGAHIPVANAVLGEEEARAVYEVVKSGWLSMGNKVREFEREVAEYVGVKHAIALNNGTSALHAALIASGVKEGDEVILPSLTFISTANVVLYERAVPVLAECSPKTYNITADTIAAKITKRTKAIIVVDMNGLPVDYDAICKLASSRGIPVIADSAESFGAEYKGRKVGSQAPVHIFSFFPNKNITTGEGGMITTGDDALNDKVRKILNQGQDRRYNHVVLGYNYRMNELQAAIGIEQLKRIGWIIGEKNRITRRYNEAFSGVAGVGTPHVPSYATQPSWYMYTVSVDIRARDRIVRSLSEMGIDTRLSFPPVHIQPYYRETFGWKDSDLPATITAWRKLINLPIWPGLGRKEQTRVIDALVSLVK